MDWIREFGISEILIVVLFALAYTLYIARLYRVGKKLKLPISSFLWKFLIRSAYLILIILAILGPAYGSSSKELKAVGKDMYICVDLSESMKATDIQPSRLQKIKFELKKIINEFSADRIGLIIFSSEAFLQCPLTFDQNALNMFVEILNTNLVPNAGTDFGPPLKMALEKINNESASVTRQKSKIIVLISDGEDFGEDTDEVVEEIVDQDIRLIALGVGTEKGSKIPTERGYKTDSEGREVITKLESRSLRAIANDTGGEYFEINSGVNDVERLINSVKAIEGEVRDVKEIDVSTNKYFYFLLSALCLILIDTAVNIKVVRL